jgi:hypothetical protein
MDERYGKEQLPGIAAKWRGHLLDLRRSGVVALPALQESGALSVRF